MTVLFTIGLLSGECPGLLAAADPQAFRSRVFCQIYDAGCSVKEQGPIELGISRRLW